MEVSLPTKDNTPPAELRDSIIFLYGRKGIGKTSLASQFPNSLTFMFERGRRNLAIRMVPKPEDPRLDWSLFLDYLDLALSSDEVDTVVIDTIDRAYEQCMHYVCKVNGCKHPNDKNDFGKTWGAIKDEFDATLGLIQDSGKGLVLLSHEAPKALNKTSKGLRREDSEAQFQYERLEPTCSKQAFQTVQEICDYVFYYGYTDEYRTITVRSPNDTCWTSCGITDTFLDPEGNPVQSFKVGGTPTDAYKSLLAAHSNELYDVNYIPPKKTKAN
jgi:hypothetical protein